MTKPALGYICTFQAYTKAKLFYEEKFFVIIFTNIRLVISVIPPVDLHWFFEISIRTEKKIQVVCTEFSVYFLLFPYPKNFSHFFSSHWKK